MKHGVAFRKFSRTSSHRMLMLRNLVTSLFEHEQIKTTLPKARDTARLAEKIITMGKKGDNGAYTRASAFLLKPMALSKLFQTFAQRYADRPGGYTRIHKFGNRQGDNAPHAILELVDNPRDLRWEMTSRAVGWEILKNKLKNQESESILNTGAEKTLDLVKAERGIEYGERGGLLRPKTRWSLQKVLRYRDAGAALDLSKKATDYVDELLATPLAFQSLHEENRAKNAHTHPPRRRAGHKRVDDSRPALVVSRALLAPNPLASKTPPSKVARRKKEPVYRMENALNREFEHVQ
ncbi:ribosomal protein L17 [Crassisporium funariophilum]|nr:ribosomal protein L17 [Crassisporium funariophilum]